MPKLDLSNVEKLIARLRLGTKIKDSGRGCSEHRSTALEREAADTLEQQAAEVLRLSKEVEELRGAMIQSGRAAGAILADSVSTEFLLLVPAEIEARIATLSEKQP